MREAKINNYQVNESLYEVKNLGDVPTLDSFRTVLLTDKDKVKLIKTIERIVRSSMEYRGYITYLQNYIDMRQCSYFQNISKRDGEKVSIHIHHEPFTLFSITQAVLEKWITLGMDINPILIAEEVMMLHYQGKVGLLPVSVTVHELIHSGKLFVPLQVIYGKYIELFAEYEPYFSEDAKEKLEDKLYRSKELETLDLSVLEKKYIYLTIDGMMFPQPIAS